jgi:NAD(P)-dependent dehydrogenase (short-subunit alcohol dehydrogenase family)
MGDKIAVVAGGNTGAGRGIACALGEGDALVYCTGRSVRGNPSPYRRPETIEETAEMIAQAGGRAVAVRVDHTVEAEAIFAIKTDELWLNLHSLSICPRAVEGTAFRIIHLTY